MYYPYLTKISLHITTATKRGTTNRTGIAKTRFNQNIVTYPFVEEKGKNMRSKCLAPKLNNQIKNSFSICRHPKKMIGKHIIKA